MLRRNSCGLVTSGNGMVRPCSCPASKRSWLARFPEDKETVRPLVATDAKFDALCAEYCKVIDLLDNFERQAKRLREPRAWLEEELLTRIEGYRPQ